MEGVESLNLNVPLGFLGNQAQIDLIRARAKIRKENVSFLNKAALPFDLSLKTLQHHGQFILGQSLCSSQ
jgi:hypothetical protein